MTTETSFNLFRTSQILQELKIDISRVDRDCDDCGSFEDGYATITLNGVPVIEAFDDGHFGGGNWRGDPLTLMLWALELLGYGVYQNGLLMVASPYFEINRDKGFKEMLDRALFTGPPQALSIEYSTAGPGEDPQDERFEHPASAGLGDKQEAFKGIRHHRWLGI